jgi:Trypsin-co-occurring domain 1
VGELLRFELDGGGAVLVEVADDEPGIEQAARVDDLVVKARVSLESALDQVRAFANATLGNVQDLVQQPEQIQVEFGIRFNAEAGAVIARTQAEGHLQVTLTWTRAESSARP